MRNVVTHAVIIAAAIQKNAQTVLLGLRCRAADKIPHSNSNAAEIMYPMFRLIQSFPFPLHYTPFRGFCQMKAATPNVQQPHFYWSYDSYCQFVIAIFSIDPSAHTLHKRSGDGQPQTR